MVGAGSFEEGGSRVDDRLGGEVIDRVRAGEARNRSTTDIRQYGTFGAKLLPDQSFP